MPAIARTIFALAVLTTGAVLLHTGAAPRSASGASALSRQGAEAPTLEVLGQFGGSPVAMAVDGDLAYVAVGARVLAADFADPAAPRHVASSPTFAGEIEAVKIVDHRVVAIFQPLTVDGRVELVVLGPPAADGSLPVLGRVNLGLFQLRTLAVSGSLVALLATDEESLPAIRVIDTADPAHPAVVSPSWPVDATPMQMSSFIFVERHLYVFGTDASDAPLLQVFDYAEPARPRVAARIAITGYWAVVDGQLLLALGPDPVGRMALRVVNVADPAQPVLVAAVPVLDPADASEVVDLAAASGFAFVLSQWGRIDVYDVADPTAPRRLGTIERDAADILWAGVANGRFLFLAESGSSTNPGGLAILDFAQPQDVRERGTFPIPGPSVHGVALADEHAYITTLGTFGAGYGALWALNLTDPAYPRIAGLVNRPVGYSSVARQGNFLYVSGAKSGLDVVDITQPGRPRLRGTAPEGAYAEQVVAGSGRVFLSPSPDFGADLPTPPGTLLSFDVADPDRPQLLSQASWPETGFTPYATSASGRLLYGLSDLAELLTLDVHEPEHPRLARQDRFDPVSAGLAAAGHWAVLGVERRLAVYDIGSVSGTRRVGDAELGHWAEGVAVFGDLAIAIGEAHVTDGTVVSVLDLTRPLDAAVVVTTTLPTGQQSFQGNGSYPIAMAGDIVAIGTQDSGLVLLRLTIPGHPFPMPTPLPPPPVQALYLPVVARAGYSAPRTGTLSELGRLGADATGIVATGTGEVVLTIVEHVEDDASDDGPRLAAVDFADAAHPRVIGRSKPLSRAGTHPHAVGLVLRGTRAYALLDDGTLSILDVGDLARLPVLGSTVQDGTWSGIVLSEDQAYLYGEAEVRILDLTKPDAPRPLGQFPAPPGETGALMDLAVRDGVAVAGYLASNESAAGVMLVDVRNPAQPRVVGTAMPSSSVSRVTTDGRQALVMPAVVSKGLTAGIVALDITDPSQPRESGIFLDQVETNYPSAAMAWLGNDLVAAIIASKVQVLDLTRVDQPRLLASVESPWNHHYCCVDSLVAHGRRLYNAGPMGVVAYEWLPGRK
jgi:hypothetical protein